MDEKSLFLWLNTLPKINFLWGWVNQFAFCTLQLLSVHIVTWKNKIGFSLQVWTKKGSSEKGRGQNSKLPPRFAKKQQQAAAAAAQQAQAQAQAQAQPPCPAQSPAQPQAPVPSPSQAAAGTASTDYTVSGKVLQSTQPHNGLAAELWDSKVPPTAVLNDISKKCKCWLLDLGWGQASIVFRESWLPAGSLVVFLPAGGFCITKCSIVTSKKRLLQYNISQYFMLLCSSFTRNEQLSLPWVGCFVRLGHYSRHDNCPAWKQLNR